MNAVMNITDILKKSRLHMAKSSECVSVGFEQRRSEPSASSGLSQQHMELSCSAIKKKTVDKHCFKMAERSQRCGHTNTSACPNLRLSLDY